MYGFMSSKYFKVFLVISILVCTFLVVFHPHLAYKYPFHIDEWHHISIARIIFSGEGYYLNFEIGFDLFLALLMKLGFDLVLIYRYLPAVFACVSSIALFFLMYSLTRKFYLAASSMLFFMFLPTNINILGIKFFTPLTFAIPFIYFFVLLFVQGFEKEDVKLIFYSSFVFLVLLFIHPVSATFMIPVMLFYALFHVRFIKKNALKLLPAILCPLVFVLVYMQFFDLSLYEVLAFAKKYFIFPKGWTPLEMEHPLSSLYHVSPFLLASLGFFFALKKNLKIFTVWALTTFVLLEIFIHCDVSIFAPYQRMLYYFMLAAVPLSAVGFYKILSCPWRFLPKMAALGMIALLIGLFFFHHATISNTEEIKFYQKVEDSSYEAIKFLEPFERSVVIAPKNSLSVAVYSISGHVPVATLYFHGSDDEKSDLDRFFKSECPEKNEIIGKYGVGYVIVDSKSGNCGWEKIYDEELKVYKT